MGESDKPNANAGLCTIIMQMSLSFGNGIPRCVRPMIPHSVFDIASAASILFVFFLLLFIYFFYVSSFLSFRLWPASRSTEIISQYLGKKKLHRIMYYKIVLLQRVGKKKRTDRPEPIKTANRKEKNFCSPIKEVWNCFFFLCCFLVCSGVTLLFCFVAVDLVCAAQSGWRKRRPSRCARPTSRRWASDCASPSSTHPVRPPSPLLPFTGFHRVLPSFTGFYQILPGFTGFYRV